MEEIMKEFERNLMKQIEAERRDLDQSEYTENQLKTVNAQYQALKNQTDLRKQKEYDVATGACCSKLFKVNKYSGCLSPF